MDTAGYYQKYKIERLDGKPLGRTITIELDSDPHAGIIARSLARIYFKDRPAFARDLIAIADELDLKALGTTSTSI